MSSSKRKLDYFKYKFKNHIFHHSKVQLKLFLEVLIGSFLGLILGFFMNLILPKFNSEEKVQASVGWIVLQVFIDGFIMWFVIFMFNKYTPMFKIEKYEGIVGFYMFGLLFFLGQRALVNRIDYLYNKLEKKIKK